MWESPLQIQYTYKKILYLWIKQSTPLVMARFKQNCPDLTLPTGQGLLWIGAKSMIILTNHDSKTLFVGGINGNIYVIQFFLIFKMEFFPF